MILLVYVAGVTEDEQMLTAFNQIKAKYAAQGSFFSFEAHHASELGSVLAQLKITQPPAFAVISPDGKVYQEYTGWISPAVMSQVVANALAKVEPPDILEKTRATPPPGAASLFRGHDRSTISPFDRRCERGTIIPTFSVGILSNVVTEGRPCVSPRAASMACGP